MLVFFYSKYANIMWKVCGRHRKLLFLGSFLCVARVQCDMRNGFLFLNVIAFIYYIFSMIGLTILIGFTLESFTFGSEYDIIYNLDWIYIGDLSFWFGNHWKSGWIQNLNENF